MTERNPILQSLFDRKSVRVYEAKTHPCRDEAGHFGSCRTGALCGLSAAVYHFRHHRPGTERSAGRKL